MERKFDFQKDASEIARDNYTSYSIYVNSTRALADISDGLKFVQRRILNEARKLPDTLTKSTNIVGNAIKYHPHGSDSIYGALVGMANPTGNLPLFDIQGNFGGFGFSASADHYTEAKISKIARFIYCQFVDYAEMITGEIGHIEPKSLPCLIPYGLISGQSGIGVGLSSDIAPLNIMDLIDYNIDFIKNEKFDFNKTPRPDFGAVIIDMTDDECRKAVNEYRGTFMVKSIVKQESDKLYVINALYDKKIEAVLRKLKWYIDSDKVDFRNESKTSCRYVFEIVDKSVDADKFKNDLENATWKRCTFNRVFTKDGSSIYSSLNYVIQCQMKCLNDAIDRKLKSDKDNLLKRSALLTCLEFFKKASVFKDIGQLTCDDLIDKMNKLKEAMDRKFGDSDKNDLKFYTDDVGREIFKKPISYLTKDHDNELSDIQSKLEDIRNHDRKEFLVDLYIQLKEMIRPFYESKFHSILASQVITDPRARLISDENGQRIHIFGKGRGARGLKFNKSVFLIGKNGSVYKRTVSATSNSELNIDVNEEIVTMVTDKCRYILIRNNDGTGLAVDIESFKYDKRFINMWENEWVVSAETYGDNAPEEVKNLVRSKISRPCKLYI